MRKKATLDNFIQEHTPDVIIGTESWLNPTISSAEIFSPHFDAFRKTEVMGMVVSFWHVTNSYNWESLPLNTSDSDLEAIACKLQLQNDVLIITAVYRPPNSNFTYLQSMCQLIEDVVSNSPNATIWVGGNLNLPNIDWTTNSPHGNNYPLSFCNIVLDLFSEINLTQLVYFPTTQLNLLDIFATNRPTLTNKCD